MAILAACDEEKSVDEIIHIDVAKDILRDVRIKKIVVLDSVEAGVIGGAERISKIHDKILIFDQRYRNTFLLYDSTGTYLKSLGRGRGPGEVLSPVDYTIKARSGQLQFFDIGQKKSITTDFNLEVIEEEKLDIFGRCFEALESGEYLIYSQSHGYQGSKSYSYELCDPDLTSILRWILGVRNPDLERVRLSNTISREPDFTVFCRPFDHNIYYLNGQDPAIRYFLDFGDLTVTEEDLELGLPIVYDMMREGQRVSIDGRLINTDKYFSCSFAFKKKLEYFIYDKDSEVVFTSVGCRSLPYGQLVGIDNENLVLLVQPETFREFLKSSALGPGLMPVNTHHILNYILVYFTPLPT